MDVGDGGKLAAGEGDVCPWTIHMSQSIEHKSLASIKCQCLYNVCTCAIEIKVLS